MKIQVFDSWRKFMGPVVEHWRADGHEVGWGMHWGPELVENADVAYFYPVDNNLKQASRRQEKPPHTRIVAEAVDIDIYAGHPGGVNWDYVDALVVMAPHMLRLLRRKFGKKIPPDLPVHVVPGGVDLEHFTLRKHPRGYNVAWVGRLWIAKNVFGALQIFHQLIKTDPVHPWRLFLRGEKYDPPWWQNHVEAYLEACPELAERVTFTPRAKDMNEWLNDKDFLLQTSFKEAFSYICGESAAKGIRPVIQMTNGARDIWGDQWVFDTHDEAVKMLLEDYDPHKVREVVALRYPLKKRVAALSRICGLIEDNSEKDSNADE
jgi:glycosyltransferase involved in cell wall biosynthesis